MKETLRASSPNPVGWRLVWFRRALTVSEGHVVWIYTSVFTDALTLITSKYDTLLISLKIFIVTRSILAHIERSGDKMCDDIHIHHSGLSDRAHSTRD